jgi:hypothetical protein
MAKPRKRPVDFPDFVRRPAGETLARVNQARLTNLAYAIILLDRRLSLLDGERHSPPDLDLDGCEQLALGLDQRITKLETESQP